MKKVMLGAVIFVLAFQMAAFAGVTVGKGERVATWMISTPGGKQIAVGPKDSLPAIEEGSTVLVPGGEAQLTTTGKSTVWLIESGVPFKVSGDSTIKRTAGGQEETVVEVLAGKVTVTKPDNQVLEMDTGDQVLLTKAGNLNVVKGEVVLSESSGKAAKFGAGKSIEGFCKMTPAKNPPPAIPKI